MEAYDIMRAVAKSAKDKRIENEYVQFAWQGYRIECLKKDNLFCIVKSSTRKKCNRYGLFEDEAIKYMGDDEEEETYDGFDKKKFMSEFKHYANKFAKGAEKYVL